MGLFLVTKRCSNFHYKILSPRENTLRYTIRFKMELKFLSFGSNNNVVNVYLLNIAIIRGLKGQKVNRNCKREHET